MTDTNQEVHFTNHLVFVATGRGIIRVGDSALAAQAAWEAALYEHLASTQKQKLVTDEVMKVTGHMPISTLGWVEMGTDIDSELYQ